MPEDPKMVFEILQRILMHTNKNTIYQLTAYAPVLKILKSTPSLWNSFCSTENFTIDECRNLIRQKQKVVRSIKSRQYKTVEFKTHQADITGLVAANGKIYIASDDQTVKSFHTEGRLEAIFRGHTGGIWAIDTTENHLVTGSTDKTAKIWSLADARCVTTLRSHLSTIRVLRCHNDYIITGGRDGRIGIWKSNGAFRCIKTGHTNSIRCLDVSGKLLVSGSYDCTVRLWNYAEERHLRILHTHTKRVYAVKMHKGYVASAGLDASVCVCKIDGSFKVTHNFHTSLVAWISFFGNNVITSGSDGQIINFDYIQSKLKYVIRENAFIKAQKIFCGLLVVATTKYVNVYSLETGECFGRIFQCEMIYTMDANDDCIVVGHNVDGCCKIAVIKFEDV